MWCHLQRAQKKGNQECGYVWRGVSDAVDANNSMYVWVLAALQCCFAKQTHQNYIFKVYALRPGTTV